ncbi:MAG: PAS domain S-box protein, partial [Prolixibacteraceae bacterium]
MKTKKKAFGVSTVYIVIFLLLEISIVIGGFRHYKNFERDFNVNVENQFRLIADLKVREIEHWLFERKSDAAILFDNEVFAALVKKHFENPEDTKVKGEIRVWMEKLHENTNNEAVMLLDPQLVKKIVIPESAEGPGTFISPGNIDSLRQDKLVFEDFFRDEFKQKIFLKILVPVLDVRQLIGIIEIRIDPQHYFYPTLQNWPMPGETSEAMIFRREGKDAVCVSELKFQKDAALNLRFPLEQKSQIAVQPIIGKSGPAKGIGYHGKAVIAHVDKVPNSPWYLVAQTDETEVNHPLEDKLLETISLFFSLFLLAGIGMVMVWRYQQSQLSKERIKSEKALFELNLAIQNSRDVVFLTDIHGTITYINPEFTKTYGYPAEEVVGKVTPRILNSGMYQREDFRSFWNALLNKQTVHKTEYFNRCKDGQLVEIESTANSVINQQGDIIGFLGIQRDITLRKRSELEQSVIYEIIHSLTITDNLSDLLKLIHQSLGKVLYAENIFVALQDQKTGLFSFPYWIDQFDSAPEPVSMRKSISHYVFQTGKPVLFSQELFQQLKEQNEVELVGSPSPSWIGVPLKTADKTIGILVLQHYEKENIYSEHDTHFLNAAGSQIAIAIERKQAEEALRNSENELNVVLQSTADGILAIDGEGKVIKSNKRFTDLFSIPPSLMNTEDSYALVDYILEQLINPDEVILKEKKLYHSTENDLDILYFRDGR